MKSKLHARNTNTEMAFSFLCNVGFGPITKYFPSGTWIYYSRRGGELVYSSGIASLMIDNMCRKTILKHYIGISSDKANLMG